MPELTAPARVDVTVMERGLIPQVIITLDALPARLGIDALLIHIRVFLTKLC